MENGFISGAEMFYLSNLEGGTKKIEEKGTLKNL